MPHRHHHARARGFTLIELMMVCTVIGILASIAILGYRKYIHAAQSSEGKVIIGQIRSGEEQYRAEMLSYLQCSATLADYYPNPSPDDSRWAWVQPTNTKYSSATNGWKMLNVRPDGPVRYGYAVMAGIWPDALPTPGPGFSDLTTLTATMRDGTPWYVIQARNKHNSSQGPSMMITTSYDNKIYIEGEGD